MEVPPWLRQMQESETLMLIADPGMTGGWSMTQIILKTAVWKEGAEKIAGRGMNGGKAASGSATGRASARMMNRSGLKTPSPRSTERDFAPN